MARGLVDTYDIYQRLMDYWTETMQDDCYILTDEGWKAETYRVIEKDKAGKEKDKGWACDLAPKALIVASFFIKELQQRNERVAFIGDGINDAPALEQAGLGIAVSRASDIAREAADIILLKSEIQAVPESLGLGRATLRTIKQNLFWAFFYHALGIPLAALGFMSPILCAVAMGISDLVVIGNALRLLRWRMKPV